MHVTRLVGSQVCRVGLDTLGDLNGLPTSFVQIGPVTRADAGHERRSESASLLGGEYFDGPAVDSCLNLPPQRPARATAAQSNGADRNSKFREEGESVLQRVGHTFQHRAYKVGRRMSRGDTGKGRPCLGVKVRRALTQQIGCVLFELGGTGNIPYCSSNQTKDGRIRYLILDATNLNLRSLLESPSFVL